MSTACYIAFGFFFCSSYISCIHVSLPSPITSMLAFQVEHIVLGWSGCYVPPHVLLPCDDGVWAWLCLIFYFVYVLNLLWWFCTFISLCFLQTEKKIAKEKRKTLLSWSRDIIGIWGRRSDGEVKFIWAGLNLDWSSDVEYESGLKVSTKFFQIRARAWLYDFFVSQAWTCKA